MANSGAKKARPFSKRHYFFAALITFGIFSLGMLLGMVVEAKRVSLMQGMYEEQKTNFASSQLQYEYLNQLTTNESCPAIYALFAKNTVDLGLAQERLETFQKDSKINKADFELLKRQYVIEEMRYYLLAKRAKEMCKTDLVRLVYFYSDEKGCPDCSQQEFVLNYLKKMFGDKLLIFALDEKLESEPMISMLKKQHGATQFPTLVIDDEVYSGFRNSDELKRTICTEIGNASKDC